MSQGHIFLVGCARSGTTLLQSILATQPAIASFPESRFFVESIQTVRDFRLVRWGLRPFAMPQQLSTFAHQIGYNGPRAQLPRYSPWLKDYVAAFVRLLDMATVAVQKTIWLEKTPAHLRYIDLIEHYIPDAKFIHLVRNGADVVASLSAVVNEYPTQWRERLTLDQCIERWQSAIALTSRYLARSNHILVRYESLVTNPQELIQTLCCFIHTPFRPDLLQHYIQQAETLILPFEVWKVGVKEPIANRNGVRFSQIFDNQQQTYIIQALAPFETLLAQAIQAKIAAQ